MFLSLNPCCTPREVPGFLEDTETAVLVAAPVAATALGIRVLLTRLFTLDPDGTGSLVAENAGRASLEAIVPRAADDLAAILDASGATGKAKGAMICHRNLATTIRA